MSNDPTLPFRETRYKTHTAVILEARGFGRFFVMKNLSRSGAGLEGDKPLKLGERVTLNLPHRRVDAIVRWTEQNKVGLRFNQGLKPNEVRAALRQRARTEAQPYRAAG